MTVLENALLRAQNRQKNEQAEAIEVAKKRARATLPGYNFERYPYKNAGPHAAAWRLPAPGHET